MFKHTNMHTHDMSCDMMWGCMDWKHAGVSRKHWVTLRNSTNLRHPLPSQPAKKLSKVSCCCLRVASTCRLQQLQAIRSPYPFCWKFLVVSPFTRPIASCTWDREWSICKNILGAFMFNLPVRMWDLVYCGSSDDKTLIHGPHGPVNNQDISNPANYKDPGHAYKASCHSSRPMMP